MLKPTDGSLDNLELLRKGEADVAFVRGGSADPVADEEAGLQLAGQPVLRAAVVVLPHRRGAQGRPQDRPR